MFYPDNRIFGEFPIRYSDILPILFYYKDKFNYGWVLFRPITKHKYHKYCPRYPDNLCQGYSDIVGSFGYKYGYGYIPVKSGIYLDT